MAYSEHTTALAGTLLWQRPPAERAARMLVLPDGCIDLIWDGTKLFVAGPDTSARWVDAAAGSSYAALRFSGGVGPAVLGVRADECTDLTPAIDELWGAGEARRLTEQVAAEPTRRLFELAGKWAANVEIDPFGPTVQAMAAAGWSVATMAARLGTTARHLHRRSLAAFGYGPRRLSRILRFGRAVGQATGGAAWADIAADCGYADQAHLSREFRELAGATPVRLLAALDALHPAAFG